jgi:ankyrin repeat protein
MHLACRRQDAELVKIFVELGSPVDKTNIEGQTPLHIAAINGDQNVLRILLMARSDSSICDKLVITYFLQYPCKIGKVNRL